MSISPKSASTAVDKLDRAHKVILNSEIRRAIRPNSQTAEKELERIHKWRMVAIECMSTIRAFVEQQTVYMERNGKKK